MLDQLEIGQSVTIAVPSEDQAWELMHLETGYLIHAPVFEPRDDGLAAVIRGCLLANGAPALGEASARLVFRSTEVVLEALLPLGSGQAQLQDLVPLVRALREAALGAEEQRADDADAQAQEDRHSGDASPQTLLLFQALDRLVQGDAELAGHLSIDLIQGEAHFEGDDGSWLVAVGVSPDECALWLSTGVCVLPDGEEAAELIRAAMAIGGVRSMGASFRLGCDPACALLLVSTAFQPHTASADDLKAAIGGLLLLAERTAARLPIAVPAGYEPAAVAGAEPFDAGGSSGASGLDAPPGKDDSLAFYARIRA